MADITCFNVKPSDSLSVVTKEDTQSPGKVFTLQQDEGTSMEKTCLMFESFHSISQNDVVPYHETTDSGSSNSLTTDFISGSSDSEQTIQESPVIHEVSLVSDLASLKESSFSDSFDKEVKDFELGNDNKFLGNDVEELGCPLALGAGKKQLLEEVEASIIMAGDSVSTGEMRNGFQDGEKAIDFDHIQVHTSNKFWGNDNELGSRLKMINEDPRCSLEIQVVDETALIGPVSVPKLGWKMELVAPSKSSKGHVNKNRKEDFLEKVVRGSPRRHKGRKNVALKKGDRSKRMYSREEMEALRFVNIVEQRKMWKDVHTGLGPIVRKEYDCLVSSKNQRNFQFNFAKKNEPTSVLSVVGARGRSNHMNVFVH
ncbi:uncharacterized protein LOC133818725 [Humulus lupulus]|uniref:uncharacterized protein LOC133818725 n=1 Tax=Humulus lupulus TaxID=3486 RepID=UPI002B404E06|nr:uncharacterized protein LOC133818725 [Humulus lupulus]